MTPPALPNRLLPFILHFVRQFAWGCTGLLVFPMLSRLVTASVPYATKRILDTVLAGHRLPGPMDRAAVLGQLTGPVILFAALTVGKFAADGLSWLSSYHTRIPMAMTIKRELFAYVQRLSPDYFENNLSGKIAHRTIMLPDHVMSLCEITVFDVAPAFATFVFAAAYFYVASPLFCAVAAAAIVVYVSVGLYVGRRCAGNAALANEMKARVTGRIVDVISNIRNVFFFSNQSLEDAGLARSTSREGKARIELYLSIVRLRAAQYVMDIVMTLGFVLGALYAWLHGYITAGDFVMISTLTNWLLQTAYSLGQRMPDLYDQLGSARDGVATLIVPATIRDATTAQGAAAPRLTVTAGAIDFSQVSFAYETTAAQRRQVIKTLNLHIPAGQRVGLVGPSGAGKTTLMTLLMRMHDVTQGSIRIDGQDVREVEQRSLRASLGLIPQDTTLFHRSLAANLRYGRPDATDEQVREAAVRAHAHEFIALLEEGYESMVGERGIKLSGGQRQRIAIARAILKDAPILLLDEATSALDSESEHLIQLAMREAMRGKTVIAIAHRLSTLMDMDRLIVLDGGRIVADGTHTELLRDNGLYADLWRRQSGGFMDDHRPAESLSLPF